MMGYIDTDKVSTYLRKKAIIVRKRAILITNFHGTEQEKDLSVPANCKGYGRIHHFKMDTGKDWIKDPLPILPASKALNVKPESQIRAQVFQNAVCNWRCWYCFVDSRLLNGDSKHAAFLTCEEMLDLYLKEIDPAPMIDLSGGHPGLTPEWIPWMMQALKDRGLENKVYLWSDDNLSSNYLWEFLTDEQIDLMSSYKMYSRVCCFKGIDERSFCLNTNAAPEFFAHQFELCKRLLEINLDLYCYITITANTDTNFEMVVPNFFDKVQKIDEMLPLRIVPLRIFDSFSPIAKRMDYVFKDMINGQKLAVEVWKAELSKRFTHEQLKQPITEIKLIKH